MAYKDKEKAKKHRDKWYYENKEKQIARQMERRRELRESLTEYKKTLSCTDCGMSFNDRPECCDFHHLDPSIKDDTITRLIMNSKAAVEKELEKCIPLCANCHRTRHKHTGIV